MGLDDILDDIQAEQPRATPRVASNRSETFCYGDELRTARWSPEDKLPSYSLPLSEYERRWLVTRMQVHLRSYEHYEWSEMKDVLQTVLKRLEALTHAETNTRTESTSGVGTAAPTNLATSQPDAPSPHAPGPGDVQSDGPEAG